MFSSMASSGWFGSMSMSRRDTAAPDGPLAGRAYAVVVPQADVRDVEAQLGQLGAKRVMVVRKGECVLTSAPAMREVALHEKVAALHAQGVPLVDARRYLAACAEAKQRVDVEAYTLPLAAAPPPRESSPLFGTSERHPVRAWEVAPENEEWEAPLDDGFLPIEDTEDDYDAVLLSPQLLSPQAAGDEPPLVLHADPTVAAAGSQQPQGLPPGASSRPLLAKLGPAKPQSLGRGFVRDITPAERNALDTTLLDYRILHNCHMAENKNKFYVLELVRTAKGEARIMTHYGRTDDMTNPLAGKLDVRHFKDEATARQFFGQLCTEKYQVKQYRDLRLVTCTVGTKKLQQHVAALGEAETPSAPSRGVGVLPSDEVTGLVASLHREAVSTLENILCASAMKDGLCCPLGTISRDQIRCAAAALDRAETAVQTGVTDKAKLDALATDFFSHIPHRLGRGSQDVWVKVIDSLERVQEKRALLDLIEDVTGYEASGGTPEERFVALGCDVTLLNPAVEECSNVRALVEAQRRKNQRHQCKVLRVFKLAREADYADFNYLSQNERLLYPLQAAWALGALSHGLRRPASVELGCGARASCGRLGRGIIFYDSVCSASRYMTPLAGSDKAYCIVASVTTGTPHVTRELHPQLTEPTGGHDSMKGQGCEMIGSPAAHGEDAFVDNEYAVYRESQVAMEYLVELDMPARARLPPLPQVKHTPVTVATQPRQAAASVPSAAPAVAMAAAPDARFVTKNEFSTKMRDLQRELEQLRAAVKDAEQAPLAAPVRALPAKYAAPIQSSPPPAPVGLATPLVPSAALGDGDAENNRIATTERKLREGLAQGVRYPPFEFLVDVYGEGAGFHHEELTASERSAAKLLQQYVRPVATGASSVVPQGDFHASLQDALQGQLDGVDWSHLFLAGGCVLGALLPKDVGSGEAFRGTDIDLFLHGIDDDEKATAYVEKLVSDIAKNRQASKNSAKSERATSKGGTGGDEPEIVRTAHALTIMGVYPFRHVQIVLRMYQSPAEVLIGFDVDSCTVGYDGSRAWANPRARRAINKQINTVDMTRRSLTYELRLRKYARRGFAVAVPGLTNEEVDTAAGERVVAKRQTLKAATGLLKLVAFNVQMQDEVRQKLVTPATSSAPGSRKFKSRRKKMKKAEGRGDWTSTTDDESAQECDYSNVLLPWGPCYGYYTLMAAMEKSDKAQYFASVRSNPALHRHVSVSGPWSLVVNGCSRWCAKCNDQKRGQGAKKNDGPPPRETTAQELGCSLEDAQWKYVYGRPKWLRDNPGRQLMTGSFHPVSDDKWFDNATLRGTSAGQAAAHVVAFFHGGVDIMQWSTDPSAQALSKDTVPIFGVKKAVKKFPQQKSRVASVGSFPAKAPMPVAPSLVEAFGKKTQASASRAGFTKKAAVHALLDDDSSGNETEGAPLRVVRGPSKPIDGNRPLLMFDSRCVQDALQGADALAASQWARGVIVFVQDGPFEAVSDKAWAQLASRHSEASLVVVSENQRGQLRRPHPGVFAEFKSLYPGFQAEEALYIGRRGEEYRDKDYCFAVNCGVAFEHPDEFFHGQPAKPRPVQPFDPIHSQQTFIRRWARRPEDPVRELPTIPASGWMVLLVGRPGAGKTTFYKHHLLPQGLVHINRDTLGTMEACLREVLLAADAGASVCIDNMNDSAARRKVFLDVAKKLRLKAACIVLDVPEAVAMHQNVVRSWKTGGRVAPVPSAVFATFKKQYEAPEEAEGFEEGRVHTVPFLAEFDSPMDERYFHMVPGRSCIQ